jgi:intein/homing endonuclease
MSIKYDDTFVKKPLELVEYTPERLLELKRCSEDITHFLKYVRIVHPDLGRIPFNPYDFQKQILRTVMDNRFSVILCARQAGKSTVIATYALWYAIFHPDKTIGIVSNKALSAIDIMARIKITYEELPPWLKPGVREYSKTFTTFDNESKILLSATSADAFRGRTLNLLVADEFAFVRKNIAEDFWSANYPTISSSQDAKIIIISCVAGETYVFTNKGIKQVNDFVKPNINGGYSIDNYSILGKDKINNGNIFVNSGKAKTRILESTSSKLEGSLNHKLWACKNGIYDWYKLSDLEIGDYISIQYGMNLWGNNDIINFEFTSMDYKRNDKIINRELQYCKQLKIDKITSDWAYLFGLYISEGNADKHRLVISCGDDISDIFNRLNIKYTCKDNMHYVISSTAISELLKYIGFDISKHAPEKEIPKRLLEMSKENIIAMLQGIFDGDGWSRKDRGTIGIGLSSEKLINQIRMILLNFGILTDYYVHKSIKEKCTGKVKSNSTQYRLSCGYNDSRKFYDTIGFKINRKQNKRHSLPIVFKEAKIDVIPFANIILENIKKELKEKYNVKIHKEELRKHLSRPKMLRIKELLKQYGYLKPFLENISENIKWEKIKSIKESENDVFDFSLPDIENDPWCHSVIYNGLIGHQTPNGMWNLFHKIYSEAEHCENTFIPLKFTWRDVPGRDKAWADEQRRNLGKVKFAQEQLVEFLGSTNTVIDPNVLEIVISGIEEPILTDLNGKLLIYEKPEQGNTYVIGCLPPNEKVLTNNGIKDIIDVNHTDKLYDENGNETKIKNIQIYKDFEGYVYDIETYGSIRKTKFTGEHPLLISHQPKEMKRKRNHPIYGTTRYRDFDFQYTKTENVNIGDWVCFPNIYNKTISFDDLDKKWNKYKEITRMDFQLTENPLKDKDFWWFIGMWLGDGWIQNRNNSYSIHTCHDSKKEYHFAEKIKKIIERYCRYVNITKKDEESTICTQFNSKQIHYFLQDTFGQYSHGKYISEWVKYIPIEYKQELIRGYIDSDGCILYKNNQCSISIVSVSLYLMEDIQDILYSLGYISSIGLLRKKGTHNICGRTCNIKETYQLKLYNYDSVNLLNKLNYKDFDISKIKSIQNRNKRYCYFNDDKTQIYIRIKNITKSHYMGDVYNFETDSHTFLCRNLTTHNCDVAKGTGENYSVMQILKLDSLNPLKFTQVATYLSNTIDVYSFADVINRTSYYFNNAMIMCENNAEGSAIVNRIWWEHENPNLINSGGKTTDLGIRANKTTKPKAVLLMKKLIEDGDITLKDRETIKQLSSFIDENGKYKGKDTNDDCVSALYWAIYIVEMNVLDKYHVNALEEKSKEVGNEDVWGILSDAEPVEEDFRWLLDRDLF